MERSMSTVTLAESAAPQRSAVEVHPVTQARVIRSEWIKFSTLRSTWITLVLSMIGTVGIGALASWGTKNRWSRLDPGEIANFSAVSRSLFGVNLAQLAVVVLGVLIITGEYATGMIRATLASTPTRLPVLWAKLGVVSAVMFVTSLVAAVIAFFLGQALLASHGVGLSSPHAVRAIIGAAIYLTVIGILSMGVGFAVRNTAGGIASAFGLLLVIPDLGNALPSSWQPHVLPYLPSNAGSVIFTLHPDSDSLGPWTGFLVLCLWAAAAVALGALRLMKRDA
jgi:ABC-type transport system involved in multi-copper enzyme maturation permease subunit